MKENSLKKFWNISIKPWSQHIQIKSRSSYIITHRFTNKYFRKYNSLIWLVKYEDFLLLGVNFLKSYLNVCGVATLGYSEVELVLRVFLASEMNLPVVLSSAQQKQSLIKDYNKQLQEYGLTDPLKIPVSERTNNSYNWPWINLGQIFDYILKTRFSERLHWMLQRLESLFLLW